MSTCAVPGSAHIARMLIKRGSNVNYVEVWCSYFLDCAPALTAATVQPDSGMTALLTACKSGNTKAVRLLLEKSASPLVKDVRPGRRPNIIAPKGLGLYCCNAACSCRALGEHAFTGHA